MKRRRHFVLWFLGFSLAWLVFALDVARAEEPAYQRRTVTSWLQDVAIGRFPDMEQHSAAVQTQKEIDPRLLTIPDYYLAKMGPRFHVHFTIEYLSGANTFPETEEPLDPTVATIDELIEELESKIDARVVIDRMDEDHPVVHLIDNALGDMSDVLDRKINLQYTGIVGDIAHQLERNGVPGIERPRSGTNTEFYNDHVTEVTINAGQQPIRDILTHCVDFDEYSPLIWTAKTYQTGNGEWKTQIRFIGPKPVGSAVP